MDKVIELAREAGIRLDKHNGGFVNQSEFKRFYTLARADLLAENAKLRQKMVDGVTIQQYIDLDNECDVLKAENAKLRDLMREARDTCKASIVESGISAMRKEYREDLTKRLSAALGENE